MKNGDYQITVECLQYGQPRPYADHVYHYRVTITRIPEIHNHSLYRDSSKHEDCPACTFTLVPCKWSKELVEKYLKAVKWWSDKPDNPFDSKLQYIKNISEGVWEFMVTEAFSD